MGDFMPDILCKLIYVWYQSYGGGFVRGQGVLLDGGYQVEIRVETGTMGEKEEVHIETIRKNPDYHCPKGFYGRNIDGVTAVVGENGSGKTTLARMLMDCPLPSLKDLGPFFWIFVSENDEDDEFYIFRYKVPIVPEGDMGICVEEWNPNLVSAVYISNVFNFAELTGDIGLNGLNAGNKVCRQVYSPACLLRHGREEARTTRYGYRTPANQYLPGIQYYADIMEPTEIESYIKKQEELMIECYKASSPAIRKELGLFDQYEIAVAEFAKGIPYFQKPTDKDDEKNKLLLGAKECYRQLQGGILKEHNKDSLWLNLYVLCLSEIYLALGDTTNEWILELKERIKNARGYDEGLFSDMEAVVSRAKDAPWAGQIKGCLDMLRRYFGQKAGGEMAGDMAGWELGTEYFEDSEELVDWYYGELKKTSSFFKRNLSLRPQVGSGGEQMLINLFAYIADAMNQNPNQRHFLIIIDEIDAGLHPRWQQNILKYLLDWLVSFEGYRFQVIFTSHSPIVLSDMLREHVVKLKKSNGCFEAGAMEAPTFGANIAMQFLDSFFMDEGTIGSFSKTKIQDLIRRINSLQGYNQKRQEELEYLAGSIGEDIVRRKLLADLHRKQPQDGYRRFSEHWNLCSREEQRKVLEFMENLRNNGD